MQTKPKAYVFLEDFLTKAGVGPGHQPGYIEAVYPMLHEYICDALYLQVPEDRIREFSLLMSLTSKGEELQKFIDEHVPDNEEGFTTAFRKFYFTCLRGAMAIRETRGK